MAHPRRAESPLQGVIRAVAGSRSPITILEPGPPGHKLAQHPPLRGPATHGLYELGICYAGEIMMASATRIFTLKRGDIVIIHPGAWHYESYCGARRTYKGCWLCGTAVQIRCNISAYAKGKFDAYWLRGLSTGGKRGSFFEDLIRQAKARKPGWKARTRKLVVALLQEFHRSIEDIEQPPAHIELEPLEKLLRIMEARFREPLEIRSLAEEVGLTPNYLSAQFTRVFHTTFTNYLNVLRVWHAQLLLEYGWPIKEVAVECGFKSVHYFTNVFTQKCRTSPGKYASTCRWLRDRAETTAMTHAA